MYKFIDVNEASAGISMPSEAPTVNGEYLEAHIDGYRTLSVSGREALSPELKDYETGVRDGSRLQSKRYPARVITVRYRLVAKSDQQYRAAFNRLAQMLDVENAEFIFNDEQDKFFVGTPSLIKEVEPGSNAVIGEFEILCTDPFKYSVLEYEAEPSAEDGTILVDYGGTYKGFPVLEAQFYREEDVSEDGLAAGSLTGAGDCGFVAFFNEREKIIQLGNPNEADSESFAKSQTLANQTFLESGSWGTAAKALWVANSGGVLPEGLQKVGAVAMKGASLSSVSMPDTTGTLLSGVKTTAGSPLFLYKIVAKASGRGEQTVKVSLSVTTSLTTGGSYFGKGYGLKGSVYIGGVWQDITLKKTSEYWEGKSGHLVSKAVTVSGLKADSKSLGGIKFKVVRTDSTGGTSGTLKETACKDLPISPFAASVPTSYYLAPSAYGAVSGKYHGPSITRTLPADAAGELGSVNFTLTYKQKICISATGTNQLGAFQVQLTGAGGVHVAGVRILKSQTGKNGTLVFYLGGREVYKGSVDLAYNNKSFGAKEASVNTSTIAKEGGKVTFSIGGVKRVFNDSTLAGAKAERVTFMFEQYSTAAALSYNGLYWMKFVKQNCISSRDIPNKFSANDLVSADCGNGQVYLNDVLSPDLGALGNDWEAFFLSPGLNQIGVGYSDWVQDAYAPQFKVRYREVFL